MSILGPVFAAWNPSRRSSRHPLRASDFHWCFAHQRQWDTPQLACKSCGYATSLAEDENHDGGPHKLILTFSNDHDLSATEASTRMDEPIDPNTRLQSPTEEPTTTVSMDVCRMCDNKIEDSWRFCPGCGTYLEACSIAKLMVLQNHTPREVDIDVEPIDCHSESEPETDPETYLAELLEDLE